jgi:hypothetical protein
MEKSGRYVSVAVPLLAVLMLSGSSSTQGALRDRDDKDTGKTVVLPQPVSVRDADSPGRHAFQAKVRIDLPQGQCCDNAFVNVPLGKRLIIEYASAIGISDVFFFEVGTLLNGHTSFDENHLLPVTQQSGSTSVAGQAVRLYADSAVMLRASRNGAGSATAFLTISGHLIDVP